MASIGYMLKKEREKKKISLDQISEETKIGIKYLKALEADDYTIFPGETYIIGFMRNYARAIGLDPVDIVRQYKAIKMEKIEESEYNEETPIVEMEPAVIKHEAPKIKTSKSKKEDIDIIELEEPVEEVPKKKRRKKITEPEVQEEESISPQPIEEKKSINPLHLTIGIGGVLIIVGLFFLIKFIVTSLSSVEKNEIVTNLEEIKQLEFTESVLKYDFSVNEFYKIKLGNKIHTIMFERLTAPVEVNAQNTGQKTAEEFAFHLDDVIIQIKEKEKKDFDFDLDGKKDLAVNIDSFNKDIVTATIKKLHSFIVVTNKSSVTNSSATNKKTENSKQPKKEQGSTTAMKKGKIIFDAVVREKTYIKAFLDGKEQEGVIYYPKQKIHLEANDVMQLKIGNAGGIVAVVNGKKTRLGKRGEIANKIIKWEKDPYDESAYNLIIKDWQ